MIEETLEQTARRLEAFETPEWAVEAILDAELMTHLIWDPCTGKGVLADAAKARGHSVIGSDIHDWGALWHQNIRMTRTHDFLNLEPGDQLYHQDDGDITVLMNPPFSKAVEFVEKAFEIGARKVICYQGFSWYTSKKRKEFWEKHPPNRIYVCGDRSTCWRFDVPESERNGTTPITYAWFCWEKGHPQATTIGKIWKGSKC